MNDIKGWLDNMKKRSAPQGVKTIDFELIRKKFDELDRLREDHPRLLGESTPEEWEETLREALMKKDTYTISEVAELFSCHQRTIKREIARGNLKAAKVGRDYRISRIELERYWKSHGGGELFPEEPPEEQN